MNIREELLNEHSKQNAERIAKDACSTKNNFDELMKCFFGNDNRLAQVAGYSVNKAVKLQPKLIYPYLKHVVQQLERKEVHGAVIRNSVNILELVDIPEAYRGEVMNACFGFIENPGTEIAVKASSLTVLFNLTKIYSEIKEELKLIIEEKWDKETAAFKSRGRKILKAFSTK
jgi:hypothetical protein